MEPLAVGSLVTWIGRLIARRRGLPSERFCRVKRIHRLHDGSYRVAIMTPHGRIEIVRPDELRTVSAFDIRFATLAD